MTTGVGAGLDGAQAAAVKLTTTSKTSRVKIEKLGLVFMI
jgi:hypothetical protein